MIRQKIVLIVLAISCAFSSYGQDPIFSQFYNAPLQINPAFAGNSYAPNIALNYRNQWTAWAGGAAYVTYAASYDQWVKPLNSGFGLMVQADVAGQGLYTTNALTGFYSYRVQVNRDINIKLGIEAGIIQARLDWDALVFGNQLNPITGADINLESGETRPDVLNKTIPEISTGVLVYSKIFYGGLSIKHINRPNEAILNVNENLDVGLPARWTIHGGAQIELKKPTRGNRFGSYLSPNVMFIKQGEFGQLNIGTHYNMGMVFGGVWYRRAQSNGDAMIFLIGAQQGKFKYGYSYDLTISGLAGNTGGSHELSLRINLEDPDRQDINDCLQLFR